jgi:hypothetical protein
MIMADETLLEAIRQARLREKDAAKMARAELQQLIEAKTRKAHLDVIANIRMALQGGQSARQIGKAYGSSDPYTIRKLILEATGGIEGVNQDHPDWSMTRYPNGMFEIQALSLGNTGLSGTAMFKVDDDGENFSLVSGEPWMQVQLYKLGYNKQIMKEYYE